MKTRQERSTGSPGPRQQAPTPPGVPASRVATASGVGDCSGSRRQQMRLGATVGLAAVAAVAVVALAGFPLGDAFFTATPCIAVRGSARGFLAGREASAYRGRPEGMRMSAQGGEEDPTKPQFLRSPEMDESAKEIQKPPDREAALKMVAARESEEIARGELGEYYSADVPDLPVPPYHFQVPGEFGNDTLCTDPAWHTALLALTWLGLPYDVEHEDDEDEPMLIMGREVYDDPAQLLSSLPERSLMSDFVESLPPVSTAISKLEPAWKALHYNQEAKNVAKLEKKFIDTVVHIENILLQNASKGDMVEGLDLTVGDLTLAVSTFHMITAFAPEKQWTLPAECVRVKAHMMMMHDTQMFKLVVPSADMLARKYALPK